MRPLSECLPRAGALLIAAALTLAACASEPSKESGTSAAAPKPGKPVCSAPPPIDDIWKLEPVLLKQGLITPDMDREQKEAAIRSYIHNKNQAFLSRCQSKK